MDVPNEFLETSSIAGISRIGFGSKFSRFIWFLIVSAGFGFAAYFIQEQFQAWQDSPFKTVIETFPISEIEFPKVTVCPPKNTFTNLNYDLENFENVTITNKTKNDVLEYFMMLVNNLKLDELKKNFSLFEERDRYSDWYNGISEINMPAPDYNYDYNSYSYVFSGMKYTVNSCSNNGSISTKNFGDSFDTNTFSTMMKMKYILVIHIPEEVRLSGNARLILHVKMNTINDIPQGGGYDIIEIEREEVDGNKWHSFKRTVKINSYRRSYLITLDRSVNENYFSVDMEKMPGFNITWSYSIDVQKQDTIYLEENKHFIHFVNILQQIDNDTQFLDAVNQVRIQFLMDNGKELAKSNKDGYQEFKNFKYAFVEELVNGVENHLGLGIIPSTRDFNVSEETINVASEWFIFLALPIQNSWWHWLYFFDRIKEYLNGNNVKDLIKMANYVHILAKRNGRMDDFKVWKIFFGYITKAFSLNHKELDTLLYMKANPNKDHLNESLIGDSSLVKGILLKR